VGASSLSRPGPARRTSPLLFGMVLFLSSEAMLFGALFAAYFTLRGLAPAWPPDGVELSVVGPTAATVALVASSGTMHIAIRRNRAGDLGGMRRWVAASLLLGALFLAAQGREYGQLDFRPGSHAYGSIFFGITGFHGLHVLGGLVLMAVALGRSARWAAAEGGSAGPDAVAYYWHFVDAVWLGIFSTLYLVQ
jgi:cytochrome c oxidase subunit 3